MDSRKRLFFFKSYFPLELSFEWEGRVLIAGLIVVLMGCFALLLPFFPFDEIALELRRCQERLYLS